MSPKTKDQNEAIRANRRAIILDAALHVFAEEGYHAASISRVSKYAGMSKGLLYNYFESKEELLDQVLGDLFDVEAQIAIELVSEEFTKDTFKKFVQYSIKLLKSRPKAWKLYFSMATQPEVLSIIEKRFSKESAIFQQRILSFFEAQGHENPVLQMQFFFITFGGLKMQYILRPEACPVDELEALIIKQFIQ